MAGLRIPDVDMGERIARSRKAVKRQKVGGKITFVIGDIKTEAGRVEWPLTRRAVAALEALLDGEAPAVIEGTGEAVS